MEWHRDVLPKLGRGLFHCAPYAVRASAPACEHSRLVELLLEILVPDRPLFPYANILCLESVFDIGHIFRSNDACCRWFDRLVCQTHEANSIFAYDPAACTSVCDRR